MYQTITKLVQAIKEQRPLILNITNLVTMDFIANGLLSLGASPMMANSTTEMDDLVKISNSVVINLGTLHEEFIALCHKAGIAANGFGKPLILDPVGAGASHYRTATCLDLLEQHQFSIIRGNASEIMALCGSLDNTKGVDATISPELAIEQAKQFSLDKNIVIAISGKTDVIIAGNQMAICDRGSSLMPLITGSGCLLTAVIAAFHAVHTNLFEATAAAITFYGVCGETAAAKATGPGTFKIHFLDALSQLPQRENDDK
ncbi:hydroxyethylthiazole kinase [Legionella waltersii]|uniref:Hydroxyethylthiazole kinase n=1 Tax=Legionella waltersii TaxID=66969 RepID=A0A0W1A5K4_9GAMM|nr:hydroxyethylthiazole kinase [Legionella waltersii]KTD76598.1 hydroxyethylthiazole kinase [Legionella waltersii]SNU94556.1 hydroxyethylthiazole kinase [Legionella waltersii]